MELLGYLWIALLISAGFTQNPFIYHPIYFVCFSVPAIICVHGAFSGRIKNEKRLFRTAIMNSMGTVSLIVLSILLIFFNVAFALVKSGIWTFR